MVLAHKDVPSPRRDDVDGTNLAVKLAAGTLFVAASLQAASMAAVKYTAAVSMWQARPPTAEYPVKAARLRASVENVMAHAIARVAWPARPPVLAAEGMVRGSNKLHHGIMREGAVTRDNDGRAAVGAHKGRCMPEVDAASRYMHAREKPRAPVA